VVTCRSNWAQLALTVPGSQVIILLPEHYLDRRQIQARYQSQIKSPIFQEAAHEGRLYHRAWWH
jgi:hypothetical protein